MCTLMIWVLLTGGQSSELTQEEAIELAKEAVEREEEVTPETIRVRRAVSVTWPDASLGCPEEGQMYAQVVTKGYQVQLQAGTRLYRVHVSGGRAVVCGKPIERGRRSKLPEKVPPTQESETIEEVPEGIMKSILDDLVERTGAERDAVEIRQAHSRVWSDGSLGCPKPGQIYPQVLTEGYRVVLEYNGKKYDYRATRRGFFFLCETPSPSRPRNPRASSAKK